MVVLAILLALVLRSLVAPLYLVASVGLSYLASLGLAVALFVIVGGQLGINFTLPFFMFVFIMALGEDYNILLMTRIREEAATLPLRQAVVAALGTTGTTITSAGLVLAGTFGILAIATSGQVRQIGTGLSLGILLDTFVVRTLLVPRRWCCSGGGTGGRRACSPSALVAHSRWMVRPGAGRPRRARALITSPPRPRAAAGLLEQGEALEHGRRAVAPARAHHGQRRHRARRERLHLDPGPLEGLGDRGDRDRTVADGDLNGHVAEGSGWHRGMRSEAAFAAWTPAHRAASMASWAEPPARAHAGRRLRRARCSEPRPGAGWAPCR